MLASLKQPTQRCRRALPACRGHKRPLRILLLTGSLHYGGAERQVVELAKNLDRRLFEPVLCCLDGTRTLFDLNPSPTPLLSVTRRSRFDLTVLPRFARVLLQQQVEIIHCFLFDAELLGRVVGRLLGVPTVIASERNSDYPVFPVHDTIHRITRPLVSLVIANSNAGKRYASGHLGFAQDRVAVVHNGVDTTRFVPRSCACARQRAGLPVDEPVVGMFASFKEQKNHAMYFRVAKRILSRCPNAHFLCVSHTPWNDAVADSYQQSLRRLLAELGLDERMIVLTDRNDVEFLYNACDVTVLTSRREGTPNVVLESMACGVPVIATDVADNATILLDGVVGGVVPLDDDAAMAARVCALLDDDAARRAASVGARKHVEANFSLRQWATKIGRLYEQAHALRRMRSPQIAGERTQ